MSIHACGARSHVLQVGVSRLGEEARDVQAAIVDRLAHAGGSLDETAQLLVGTDGSEKLLAHRVELPRGKRLGRVARRAARLQTFIRREPLDLRGKSDPQEAKVQDFGGDQCNGDVLCEMQEGGWRARHAWVTRQYPREPRTGSSPRGRPLRKRWRRVLRLVLDGDCCGEVEQACLVREPRAHDDRAHHHELVLQSGPNDVSELALEIRPPRVLVVRLQPALHEVSKEVG